MKKGRHQQQSISKSYDGGSSQQKSSTARISAIDIGASKRAAATWYCRRLKRKHGVQTSARGDHCCCARRNKIKNTLA